MNQAPIRSFIAIDFSSEVLRNIEQVSDQLRQRIGDSAVRWVPVDNIHLTLKFLGNVPAGQMDALAQALKAASTGQSGFEVEVEKLGAFPKISQPRVIWVGMKESDELLVLYHRIEGQIERLGFASEQRPFRGHLTLGRVSDRCSKQELNLITQELRDVQVTSLGKSRVEAVYLYRSDLRPSGSVYTCLYTVGLKDVTKDGSR
jgi:2'-5' RNA ligase